MGYKFPPRVRGSEENSYIETKLVMRLHIENIMCEIPIC